MSEVTIESLLKDVGECGRFHFLVVNIVHLCKIHLAMSMLFMSFGIYNPGWRCAESSISLHNSTWPGGFASPSDVNNMTSINMTTISSEREIHYNEESCQVFESCENVEFNPEASTVITEWALVCGRSWVDSLIISLQMVGALVGSMLTGYCGDRFGRKISLLGCLLAHTLLNFFIMFSPTWTMFAACRFFIGICCAFFRFLPFVYSSEFIPPKWRGPVACHPMFATAGITLGIVCMITKDWVQVHAVITAISALTFVAVLWVPKSIRWLAVQDKEEEAHKVVVRMAKMNRKQIPDPSRIQALVKNYRERSPDSKKYSMIDLFRKGFRMSAVIVGFLFFTDNLSYYAISLGAKSLPGNIYTNMIVMYSTEYIANIYTALTGNKLGRKLSLIVSLVGSTLSLLGVVVFDRFVSGDAKDLGVLILAIAVTVFNNITWFVLTTYMSELYPTVIRSTIVGWGSLNAQIGAIVAPYLIPNSPDLLYICYLIMGCLNVVSCFLFFFLEDTTKKSLTDTWEVSDSVGEKIEDTNDEHLLAGDKDVELLKVTNTNNQDV